MGEGSLTPAPPPVGELDPWFKTSPHHAGQTICKATGNPM